MFRAKRTTEEWSLCPTGPQRGQFSDSGRVCLEGPYPVHGVHRVRLGASDASDRTAPDYRNHRFGVMRT